MRGRVEDHADTPKSRTPWERRRAAISQYRSSISTPIALRPSALAATRVLPLPANGSAITPGGQASISVSITSRGLAWGWPALVTYPLYPDAAFCRVATTALSDGVWVQRVCDQGG